MPESSLNSALRIFDATEANLTKLELLLNRIQQSTPTNLDFGGSPEYEDSCRHFSTIYDELPMIDGWKPRIEFLEHDAIAQWRFDANEIGEIDCHIQLERKLGEPAQLFREYRHAFRGKRRELARQSLLALIEAVDGNLRSLLRTAELASSHEPISDPKFDELKSNVAQIDMLLGSSTQRPPRWSDLHRHLRFALPHDIRDISEHDWPSVRQGLWNVFYTETDPIPVEVDDLGTLIESRPTGKIVTQLFWDRLSDDDFERLLFALVSSEPGYENPEWLMKTRAPDRGRDLSTYRVHPDALGGVSRKRVLIQCKHWLSKSVSSADFAFLKTQLKHWEPPRIDICVIATSGRFTADAVSLIENHNLGDSALQIEMWPESHLERLLAARPHFIAEFALR